MNDRYEEIIKQLREAEPVLQKEGELTSTIISKIQQEESLSTKETNIFTRVIRPAMTAAAVFLIGLFLFEQVNYPSEFSRQKLSKTLGQSEINDFQQTVINSDELSAELQVCINEARSKSKKMDKECVMRLIKLYKKMERQKPKTYIKKIKNRFNH